ncbi:EamA family transporter [Methylovirgula sp. 4M-Z18]|uniref:EamA family transporter n=1 Tax=Methylovirgula sp. 4M-Z18 TaxID=2293567 RepID=UPI0013145A24|nr:EamA family transporter [Methylovirgula sp. 4M-Z18]
MQNSTISGTLSRSQMLGERTLSGVGLAVASICTIQVGAALSAPLIRELGAAQVTWFRMGFSALILLVWIRPRIFAYSAAQWRAVVLLGLANAAMTFLFAMALQRIPLALTVATEFLGPLFIAAVGLRGWRAVLLPLLALAGVVLLVGFGDMSATDVAGILCALGAGVGWGSYIILTKRIGTAFAGLEGLVMPFTIAALVLTPFGVATLGTPVSLGTLAMCFGLAVLSPLIPYAFELNALRRLSQGTFGILMSLEPAVGAIAGYFILAQAMGAAQMAGIGMVVIASVAAALGEAKGRA